MSDKEKNVENNIEKKKKHIVAIAVIVAVAALLGIAIFFVSYANSPEKKLAKQLDLGNKYLDDEDYERAIAAFDKAIDIDPKCVDAYIGKAESCVALEDYDEAIATLVEGYNETEDKKIKKELTKVAKNYADEFVEKGKIDKAIEVLEDIQDAIDEDWFEDYIEDICSEDEDTTVTEELLDNENVEIIEEITGEKNDINVISMNVVATRVSEEYAWGDFFEEYPEAMWDGGLETSASYNDDNEIVQYPTYICCGNDIIDSIGMDGSYEGYDYDITFEYSYSEETTNYYGQKTIIYYDAVIKELTVYYWVNIGGDTLETYILDERSDVLIRDGVVVKSDFYEW